MYIQTNEDSKIHIFYIYIAKINHKFNIEFDTYSKHIHKHCKCLLESKSIVQQISIHKNSPYTRIFIITF